MGKTILLHACCGPCSTSSIERLIEEGYSPVLFYSNDNIYPEEEYNKRFDNLKIVAEHYALDAIKDSYDHESWKRDIEGFEGEKEGGERCKRCFMHNLKKANEKMHDLGLGLFTTTLTVSRFKNSKNIFSVGRGFDGFEEIDFKKKNGFEKSVRLSRELGLYRQSYCGCEFSMRDYEKAD